MTQSPIVQSDTWIGTADLSDVSEEDIEMDSGVQAVWEGARLAGQAYTVRIPPGDHRGVFRAIATAGPGSILVVDAGGGADRCVFGGVTAVAAKERGIAGVVIDGLIRDRDAIRELRFPVFARGWTPRAPRPRTDGRLRETVLVGQLQVNHGDYIVGDGDGVVRIRQEVAGTALELALALVHQEHDIVARLKLGQQLSDFAEQLKRLNKGQLQ
ncbi:putative aldolase [Arthrobacter globiformis NBRC 12137]|uniref:Putative 4-hydroxy-4-methyl-2-oxoglutarate aldolase n=1 Tax=Arthrobacter globiformis (strain ATCC 8010 / DSM 20124 / JCM 1332 / NBRC 12137 / NCIMB 8907 / NRRL B-2979 / 168) TaxID=1077972 RepID=H0QPR4_ARTG1|nr:RraA family protein [Arthrobacter globiformis]GAB14815.1 putative aldolase [Arthrobacter globiformis NBRC 12137]